MTFCPSSFGGAELVGRIREVYESFGFEGMDTPAMENLSTFQGKGGGENEKLMFLVQKRGADLERAREGGAELSDMALRFDHTVPLARYFATHRTELPAVFKRYQVGSVWRADRPSAAASASSCSATSTCWAPRRWSKPKSSSSPLRRWCSSASPSSWFASIRDLCSTRWSEASACPPRT